MPAKKSIDWTIVALVAILVGAGVACLLTGHSEIGAALIFGGTGLAIPKGIVRGAAILLVVFLGGGVLVACGGSSPDRPTACAVTEMACRACETARETYCGGEAVETED